MGGAQVVATAGDDVQLNAGQKIGETRADAEGVDGSASPTGYSNAQFFTNCWALSRLTTP